MLKFGVKLRTWNCLPHAKFCLKKSLKGMYPFGENLYQKFEILCDFELLQPTFHTYDVEI